MRLISMNSEPKLKVVHNVYRPVAQNFLRVVHRKAETRVISLVTC